MTLASGVARSHRASELAAIRELAVAALTSQPHCTIKFVDSGGMRPTLVGRLTLEIAWGRGRPRRGSLYLVSDADTGGLAVSRLVQFSGTRWTLGGDNDGRPLLELDTGHAPGRTVVGLVVRAFDQETNRARYVDPTCAQTALPSIVNRIQTDVIAIRHNLDGEAPLSGARSAVLRARLGLSLILRRVLVGLSRRLERPPRES